MDLFLILIVLIASYIFAELCCGAYVDMFEKPLPDWLGRVLNPAGRFWDPLSPRCKSCGITDHLVAFHDTIYKEWDGPDEFGQLQLFPDDAVNGGGKGIALLCQHCWQELSPAERLEHYELFLRLNPRNHADHQLILEAVLAGK